MIRWTSVIKKRIELMYARSDGRWSLVPDPSGDHTDISGSRDVGFGPRDWKIVSAVHGRGTLLVGPWGAPGGIVAGAWAYAPPGVRLATPESTDPDDPPLSVFGWREAYWNLDGEGNALIDHGRPADLHTCSLAEVLEHVCRRCPEHLGWVTDELERYVRTLHLQTRPDGSGGRSPSGALAARTLRTFIDDSEEALGMMDAEVARLGGPDGRLPRAGSLRALFAVLDEQAHGSAAWDDDHESVRSPSGTRTFEPREPQSLPSPGTSRYRHLRIRLREAKSRVLASMPGSHRDAFARNPVQTTTEIDATPVESHSR